MEIYLVQPQEFSIQQLSKTLEISLVSASAAPVVAPAYIAKNGDAIYVFDEHKPRSEPWLAYLYRVDRARILEIDYSQPSAAKLPFPMPFFLSVEWRDNPRGEEIAKAIIDSFADQNVVVAPLAEELYGLTEFASLFQSGRRWR